MKRKKGYETPLIEKFRVELEEGVCATGSFVKDTAAVEASNHEHGEDLDFTTTGDSGFNDITWE